MGDSSKVQISAGQSPAPACMRYSLKRLFFILFLAALFSFIIAALTTWAHPDRRLELIPAVEK